MQVDLVARLRADATLGAILATHNSRSAIDWGVRPDTANMPCVTLTDVVTDPIYKQDGRDSATQSTVQVDVWAATPLAAIQAVNRVIEIMESETTQGATFFHRAFLSSGPRSMRIEDLPGGERAHRKSADLQFYHRPI